MHKTLLFFACALLMSSGANAQFRYIFKDTVTPYVPLSGATSVNGSTLWDDDEFSIAMPFSWKMDSSISLNQLHLSLGTGGFVDQFPIGAAELNGFVFTDADIADRGIDDSITSKSPIRYLTTGTSPNRIFKLEIANGGFWDEDDRYDRTDDSFHIQIWIYETSNIVEFHYGPSRITSPSDYFGVNGSGPVTGYLKEIDVFTASGGAIYFLKGSPAAPTLDTFHLTGPSSPPTDALNSWPADGKVYRFTPRNNCASPTANFSAGTPVIRTVQYTYSGTTTGLDSLLWDFGDGQALKVTSNFTAPFSHTFPAAGRYNVCVTAYSACGSHNYCRQSPVSVGDLTSLGNVRVYPNPASDQISIEGMAAGSKLNISSLTGQQVLSAHIGSARQQVNISKLPAGTYLLTLTSPDGTTGSMRITKK